MSRIMAFPFPRPARDLTPLAGLLIVASSTNPLFRRRPKMKWIPVIVLALAVSAASVARAAEDNLGRNVGAKNAKMLSDGSALTYVRHDVDLTIGLGMGGKNNDSGADEHALVSLGAAVFLSDN